MKIVSLILLGIVLGVACAARQGIEQPTAFVSTSKNPGQNIDSFHYTDSDLQHLILHNLGLLHDHELSDTNKRIISKYGDSTLSEKTLLNYLFLIETEAHANKEFVPEEDRNSNSKHHSIKLDICATGKDEDCVVDLLHNRHIKQSLAESFENAHGKRAFDGIYFYGSEAPKNQALRSMSYSLSYEKNGNAVIIENRTGRKISLGHSLARCVNEIGRGEFKIDVENSAILPKTTENGDVIREAVLLEGNETQLLTAFMEDICAVVSLGNLLRKDATPSLFTFHITSLKNLEADLGDKQKETVHHIWNVAYNKFRRGLSTHFGDEEVAGQVAFANHNIETRVHNASVLAAYSQSFVEVRNLQEEPTPVKAVIGLTKTQLIYRIFGVGFVIVLALILVAMSSIEVQKDSLVYSKFLTVDQRK